MHDVEARKFTLDTEAGEAYVPYSLDGDTMDCYYSFVPPALRGQGVARKLVEEAFAFSKKKNYQITASCGYVAAVLSRLERGR